MNIIENKIKESLRGVDITTLTPLEVVSVECVEIRPNYDSTWLCTCKDGDIIKVIRYDDDTKETVNRIISMVPYKEILAKVAKANVYYD